MSFVDSLRMNGLFRGGSSPIGMPDMDSGGADFFSDLLNRAYAAKSNYENGSGRTIIKEGPKTRGELGNIANRVRNEPQQEKPINVVYKPDMSEYQRAQLSLARNKEGNDTAIARERIANQGKTALMQSQDRNRGFDIEEFKARHPNKHFMEVKGGNVFAFDPISGESVDTGVNTGTMSDEDKQALIGRQAMERVDKQGKNARALEGVRSGNARELEGVKNSNVLGQIAARAAESRETEKSKNVSDYIFKNPADKPKTAKRTGSITSDDGKGNRSTKYTYEDDKDTSSSDGDSDARNQAIDILKKNGKPVTDANIKFVMENNK